MKSTRLRVHKTLPVYVEPDIGLDDKNTNCKSDARKCILSAVMT